MTMPNCKDCKFYQEVNDKEGDCFGHRIMADMDADDCPTQSFQPRSNED